jgi:hypothetical protein
MLPKEGTIKRRYLAALVEAALVATPPKRGDNHKNHEYLAGIRCRGAINRGEDYLFRRDREIYPDRRAIELFAVK